MITLLSFLADEQLKVMGDLWDAVDTSLPLRLQGHPHSTADSRFFNAQRHAWEWRHNRMYRDVTQFRRSLSVLQVLG